MTAKRKADMRLDRKAGPSLRNWEKPRPEHQKKMKADAQLPMGWGKLIFAHTFSDQQKVVDALLEEHKHQRDIALYLRDPHVILSMAPDRLFLDPSHTYRLWSQAYQQSRRRAEGFSIRRIRTRRDAEAMNRIYASRRMITADEDFLLDRNATRLRTYFVAEARHDGQIVGTVTGVDHTHAFNDPENGASLWCLAVDTQCHVPGVGESLVRQLVEHYFARGRQYVDLSVMHDNEQAIALYEKLGFERVPVFCVKRKNPFNEPLFTPPAPSAKLNPYAALIVNEARRRGIHVNVLDEEGGYFELQLGGRTIVCRESLTELTTAVAMSRCDDKRITRKVLAQADVNVPEQAISSEQSEDLAFLEKHERIVVKPARGEQGQGISVNVTTGEELRAAIQDARQHCERVILEQFVEGDDLRLVVIGYEVVAAAVRKPPFVIGTGRHTVEQLIEKYNRRRMAATGGESKVPLDAETRRCVSVADYEMTDIPEKNQRVRVRHTANLHTGGTIHDVTDDLHETLREAGIRAARALDIPVTGIDMIVKDVTLPHYVVIEANERPGLANHEPQPTAEKFIDLLFPSSKAD